MRDSDLTKTWLKWGLACGLPLLALDQWTKLLVVQTFSQNEGLPWGWLGFVHVRNPGLAFGLLQNVAPAWRPLIFVALTCAALGCIAAILQAAARTSLLLQGVITLIFTGALGNLLDRFRFGAVVDFVVLFGNQAGLPAFNLADLYIALGLCGLIAHGLLDYLND